MSYLSTVELFVICDGQRVIYRKQPRHTRCLCKFLLRNPRQVCRICFEYCQGQCQWLLPSSRRHCYWRFLHWWLAENVLGWRWAQICEQGVTELTSKERISTHQMILKFAWSPGRIPSGRESPGTQGSGLGIRRITRRPRTRRILDVEKDTINLIVSDKKEPNNRKGVLSSIATIYDPLGFCCPLVLPAREINQELWRLKCDWNSEHPEKLSSR